MKLYIIKLGVDNLRKTGSIIWGALFIILGILFLAGRYMNLDFLDISRLWPLFILVPGLIFEASFFISRNNPGVLVPGGILTTIGIIFLLDTMLGGGTIHYTWPLFPLSVAIGLFQLYLFSGRHWGLLIPVGILSVVSLIFLVTIALDIPSVVILLAGALIILGIYIIFTSIRKKGE